MGAIGLGMAAAASIFGGMQGAASARKQLKMIQRQKRENQDWYNRRYNEDATQRADAQRLLKLTEESIKNRNKAAAGAQAVIGGTDESVAAAKQANNNALADTISQINANAEQRKADIESRYLNREADLNEGLQSLEQQRQRSISEATQAATEAAGSIIAGLRGKKTIK